MIQIRIVLASVALVIFLIASFSDIKYVSMTDLLLINLCALFLTLVIDAVYDVIKK